MTHPGVLPDAELMARAQWWRYEAMHGHPAARDLAQAHEAEVRRRFADALPETRSRFRRSRPWWKFW